MKPRELTQDEFDATFLPPMREVTRATEEIVDLWGYVDPLIESQYHNCSTWDWRVAYIYESQDSAYQHILVPVPRDNTYLTVVVDKKDRCIFGHFTLDLGLLYSDWRESDA